MKNAALPIVMTPDQLASALHGDRNGSWVNIAGPGHRKRDRSLGIVLDPNAPDGFRTHSLAGDDPATCRAYVKKLLKKIAVGGSIQVQLGDACGANPDAQAKIAVAMEIWHDTQTIKGTLAEIYLHARSCVVSSEVMKANVLRHHPLCPFGQYRFPALIALITDAITGEPLGIHRTALRDDGSGKREMPDGSSPKRMLGSAKRGVVRLYPVGPHLGSAEGVETALSAAQIFKTPVWAVLSANGMADFPIVTGVQSLTVFADHDTAGISAARECRRKYKKAGIGVEVRHPPLIGNDWNDHARKDASHG